MIHATNRQLKELMEQHGLSRSAAARLCMVRDPSLDRWLAPPTRYVNDGTNVGHHPNPQYRRCPEHRVALLAHALKVEIPAITDEEIAKSIK